MVDDAREVSVVLEQKALELFRECDIENKGYLTRTDFAHLNAELQLSDDAINQVFDSLAQKGPDGVGIVPSECFVAGFGVFFRCAGRRLSSMSSYTDLAQPQVLKSLSNSQDDLLDGGLLSPFPTGYDESPHTKIPDDCESGVSSTGAGGRPPSTTGGYEIDSSEWDPAFTEMLSQLTANGLEPQEDGFAELWQRLEREDPHMLPTFERFLRKVNGELSQTKSYCRSLALMLRQKVAEHDETITTLHDELEDHVRQETERIAQEIRAREAHERRMLERELEERERHQSELRVRLAVLENREKELSRMVESSKAETQQLLSEKEELEMALANRSEAETDLATMNERMRAIQQDLVAHQNQFSSEVGRLQAERDVLQNELEEVNNRNSQLRNERHILNAPVILQTEQFRRPTTKPSSPLLMMASRSQNASLRHPSRHSSLISSRNVHRRSSNASDVAMSSHRGSKSMDAGNSTTNHVNHNDSAVPTDGPEARYLQGRVNSSTQLYASNQSLDTLTTSARTKGTSTASINTIGAIYESPWRPAEAYRPNFKNVKDAAPPLFKVVFLGDSGVGKTALLHRLCYDEYRPAFNATIGMDLHMYPVSVSDDVSVMLQLWDTAGQERYRSMTRQYFRNANAFVLVYDILCETSFLSCRWWLEEIDNSIAKSGYQTILMMGNKVDRADCRVVSLEQAKSLAMERGMMFAEVSAQTGFGVHEVVSQLAVHLARDSRNSKLFSNVKRHSTASQADLITSAALAKPRKLKNTYTCLPSICN